MIKYIVIDVDGTMTDGGIYYDEHGNETKKFCTKDAASFFALRQLGIKIIVLTGRSCKATEKRMNELKVEYLHQDVKDKLSFLRGFMKRHKVNLEDIAYIGDDLNDLPPMSLAGFVGCPADSCNEIIEKADYVSSKNGGCGAVRDVVEHLLKKDNLWESAIQNVYGIGI